MANFDLHLPHPASTLLDFSRLIPCDSSTRPLTPPAIHLLRVVLILIRLPVNVSEVDSPRRCLKPLPLTCLCFSRHQTPIYLTLLLTCNPCPNTSQKNNNPCLHCIGLSSSCMHLPHSLLTTIQSEVSNIVCRSIGQILEVLPHLFASSRMQLLKSLCPTRFVVNVLVAA